MAEGAKVLIVEDDKLVARDIEASLKKSGYRIGGIARTYDEALHYALDKEIDIALMDISLEGKHDGIETAIQLRKKHEIPSVFLTSHDELSMLKKVLDTEPEGYLIKPFKTQELISALEVGIANSNRKKDITRQAQLVSGAMSNVPVGIIIFNLDGNIEFVNLFVAKAVGVPAKDIIGEPIDKFLYLDGTPIFEYLLTQKDEHSLVHSSDFVIENHEGYQKRFAGNLTPFLTASGEVAGYISVINKEDEAERKARLALDFKSTIIDDYLYIKDKSSITRIPISDITYIEAYGNYVKVHRTKLLHTALMTMRDAENLLPAHMFFRIHRSFLVALDKIDVIHSGSVEVGGDEISLGKSHKQELLQHFNLE